MSRGLLSITLVLAACGQHAAYTCASDTQCVLGGAPGVCEPDGHCAFPDPACPDGYRYEAGAGDGFGGTCVGSTDAGASCGIVGGACCSTGSACGDNAFCASGTCKQCVTDVALGARHTCYLKYDGTVWCSGQNDDGQLGNGGMSTIPTSMPAQVRDGASMPIHDATALGAGQNYSCAIRANGSPWCWGANGNCTNGGQLGDNSSSRRNHAVAVQREDGMPFTSVAQIAGDFCRTCARDTAGGVWCWGDQADGALGDGGATFHQQAVPVKDAAGVAPFSGAAELSLNGAFACVRTTTNDVYCWGENYEGELANGIHLGADVALPVQVSGLQATALAAGRKHACALEADGTMVCWGQGNQGRLGNGLGDKDPGSNLDVLAPAPVITAPLGPPLQGVASIAAGANTCALMSNKDVMCWGIDLYGQTGTGAGSYVPAPVLRSDGKPLHGATRVIAGYTRACAFLGTGALLCWGRNSEGEFGDGLFTNHGFATSVNLSCP